MSEKKVAVEESLLEAANTALESAAIYLEALKKISREEVASPDALRLQAIAKDAIFHANDNWDLSETILE